MSMHPAYPSVRHGLKIISSFEKAASYLEADFGYEIRDRMAASCSELYEKVLNSADKEGLSKSAAVVDLLLTFREATLEEGVKTAASPDVVAEAMVKLATAVFLDDVLTGILDTASGETKTAAIQARYLGREYAVELMRVLLA